MHKQLYVTISALLTMFFIAAILMVPNTSLAADRPNNNDLQKKSDTLKQEGTFFVSDAGRSHGGFEFSAEYRTNFNVKNGKGTLTFTLEIGLDDPLKKHTYRITDFLIKTHKVLMKIANHPVELVLVKRDKVWNHQFDNNYIAAWGSDAPKNEIKGSISPSIFPGLVEFWYVELRIPKN
jgi:hypothetical protein